MSITLHRSEAECLCVHFYTPHHTARDEFVGHVGSITMQYCTWLRPLLLYLTGRNTHTHTHGCRFVSHSPASNKDQKPACRFAYLATRDQHTHGCRLVLYSHVVMQRSKSLNISGSSYIPMVSTHTPQHTAHRPLIIHHGAAVHYQRNMGYMLHTRYSSTSRVW